MTTDQVLFYLDERNWKMSKDLFEDINSILCDYRRVGADPSMGLLQGSLSTESWDVIKDLDITQVLHEILVRVLLNGELQSEYFYSVC